MGEGEGRGREGGREGERERELMERSKREVVGDI